MNRYYTQEYLDKCKERLEFLSDALARIDDRYAWPDSGSASPSVRLARMQASEAGIKAMRTECDRLRIEIRNIHYFLELSV